MELLIFYILPFVICIISIFILEYLNFPLHFADIIIPLIPLFNVILAFGYIIVFLMFMAEYIIKFFIKIIDLIHKK